MLRDETLRVALEEGGFFAGMIRADAALASGETLRTWLPILKQVLG